MFIINLLLYAFGTIIQSSLRPLNIFKTFEIFLKEPLSILKDNFVQIVSIQTGNIFENKPSIDVSMMKNKAQLTVVNNEKLYNLLSLVTHRAKQKQETEKQNETA